MATILYALSGQGRGHTSRVMAISQELRARGHEVTFCCGGTAEEILAAEGEPVIPVPALKQILEANQVRLLATARENWSTVLHLSGIVEELAERFRAQRADLLITDFEAFSPRAARRIGLPVLSFNHQQVVTETVYDLPVKYGLDAFITRAAIGLIAPRNPLHVLLTSFFFPPLRRPDRTTLVQPIIRPAVRALQPVRGEQVLVYFNQTEGAEHVLEALRQVDASFIVYNFPRPENPAAYPNLVFKEPSLEGFLADLAASRAVICTAGFTLISEGLFLGKPLLVVPNRGIFEQTINALFLQEDGLGEAVIERPLRADDIRGFLAREASYVSRLTRRKASGNEEAVRCIESCLSRIGAAAPARPVPGADGQRALPTTRSR